MPQKTIILFLLATILSPVFASGQGDNEDRGAIASQEKQPPANGFIITDSTGRVVEFDSPPERIFQAGKAAFITTNTLYLFPEARERFLGTSMADQGFGFLAGIIDPSMKDKQVYNQNIGVEELISLRPDLVIMKDFLVGSMEKPLTDFGIHTIFMNLETPEAFYSEIETLGVVFDNELRAEELNQWYRGKMREIEEALILPESSSSDSLESSDPPEVLILYYNIKDGISSFNVPPMSYMQTDMVLKGGGIPAWRDMELGNRWTKVGLEQIAAWNADYVIIISYSTPAGVIVERLKEDPLWQSLTAVKNSHLYPFPRDFHSWDQPGPGWILGYRWMAGILNPDLISSLPSAMEDEARAFYKFAFGVDDELFEREIVRKIRGEAD
ncbi:MAG: ABC transporter substrate-binding protein [Spirochaetales bacterium]|nr:ABC transporter substrate-binding protein [Spirochaetales bacterium]